MRGILTVAIPGLIAGSAGAAEMQVTIELPRLNVAEYHRPYVAAWIEHENRDIAANLTVWYDMKLPDKEGETWLKDLRQWWRRTGRSLEMPVDGVSSPTQPVGEHILTFEAGKAPLGDLPAGQYHLVVEAAREVGGKELLRLPFTWPAKEKNSQEVEGQHELATVKLDLIP